MKVYILKEEDFERLRAGIDRDPQWGTQGGSSGVLTPAEKDAHDKAHRFFNFVITNWIAQVQK